MARAPLLQLNNISLTFGGNPVFDELDLVVQPGDRLALVGRNGSGKSLLMKVMAGLIEPDRGGRFAAPRCKIGYMQQDPDMTGFETLGDFAASALEQGDMYRVERAGEKLKFDPNCRISTASGGERRRAALAKLIAEAPALMLLDEPTNHLDLKSKSVLKEALQQFDGSLVLVSHDRDFLSDMTQLVYEVTPTGLKQYIGDIKQFLHEKHASSITSYEANRVVKIERTKSAKSGEKKSKQASGGDLYRAKKAQEKAVRKAKNAVERHEKTISQLEAKQQDLNAAMAEADPSDRNKVTDLAYAYEAVQREMQDTINRWEKAIEEVERLTSN